MSESTRKLVVVLLAVLAVAMVGVAALTHSYIPLFLAWIPQLPLIFIAAGPRKAVPVEGPAGSSDDP